MMTGMVMVTSGGGGKRRKGGDEEQSEVSLLALLFTALRKSMSSCRVDKQDQVISAVRHNHLEIGWPINVRHITHVTFDRFNGFLGLPVEFQLEIPSRVPSASASVFGVSAESMQCSYDSRGNSIPTILLLMQERLYSQGGLQAEGIFRINPENSQEEIVRNHLNRGIVPENIDVHCLAGLIKAWFRELPSGVLDGLSPEQVLQCSTEEECIELVKQLQPTEAALLNWAIDLMADVVEQEESNKMNARNIAMVFAPNMTQMSDPLTALMHAVQVMNFLKTLITKALRERKETVTPDSSMSPSSSDQKTDEEFDSQHETDFSCELRGSVSEYDDHAHYSNSSEDEEDHDEGGGSVSEIADCCLGQQDENDDARNDLLEDSETEKQRGHLSPKSSSTFAGESGVSLSDSEIANSGLSKIDADESRKEDYNISSTECDSTNDVEADRLPSLVVR